MNELVDVYLKEGCGRCPLVSTPKCKVNFWPQELKALRHIALKSGLKEELKWGVPCYTYQNANVAVVAAFNDYCSISFFKGSLLTDPEGILVKPGENTQAARLIKFKEATQIKSLESNLLDYIKQAIELEKNGAKVSFDKSIVYPDELELAFEQNSALKTAFESLTIGRQRGYIIHFMGTKQSKTVTSRINKCAPKILEGKGFFD